MSEPIHRWTRYTGPAEECFACHEAGKFSLATSMHEILNTGTFWLYCDEHSLLGESKKINDQVPIAQKRLLYFYEGTQGKLCKECLLSGYPSPAYWYSTDAQGADHKFHCDKHKPRYEPKQWVDDREALNKRIRQYSDQERISKASGMTQCGCSWVWCPPCNFCVAQQREQEGNG